MQPLIMPETHLARWNLTPDGPPIVTRQSRLMPVRWRGRSAMLKIAGSAEEQRAGTMLAWWGGEGAAEMFLEDGPVLLMERAEGPRSLAAMARTGADAEATAILCDTVARLHARRGSWPKGLVRLKTWFSAIRRVAGQGDLFAEAARIAAGLLADEHDIMPLHGDVHHENVLDFGARGWLAVDPKGLMGDRAFDYANLFCNPDFAVATDGARFRARLAYVTEHSGLPRERLLRWIMAWAGLSAAWFREDGELYATDAIIFSHAASAMAEGWRR